MARSEKEAILEQLAMMRFTAAKFPLGQVIATPGALAALSPFEIKRGLFWHSQGHWGEVSEEDEKRNDLALIEGTFILSEYVAENGVRFWVITDDDRSTTTVALPEEY